jgi:OmcA/MtrC family decaheme c-type cytochrome
MTASGSISGAAPDAGAMLINPTAFNPTWPVPAAGLPATDAAMKGVLVENGVGFGDYTYTFPTGGTTTTVGSTSTTIAKTMPVAYDPAKASLTHTVWIQLSRQTDLVNTTAALTFSAYDAEYNFVPDGSGTPMRRQIVATSQCSKCHSGFRPQSSSALQFHGGGRVEANFCNICHNPGRVSNPNANSARFVHRIHYGEHIQTANQFHGIGVTYPQDIRNCGTCHDNSLQPTQYLNRPSIMACGSCHDGVDFTGTLTTACTNPPAKGTDGIALPCAHVGGVQDDTTCAQCHTPAKITSKHVAVASPDPNVWTPTNTTGVPYTNASYVAAAGEVPPNATVVTYNLKSVSTWTDTDGGIRPQAVFKLLATVDGGTTDVNFGTYDATNNPEIMPGFVGAPSVYFAWALPQDGIAAPADYNMSAGCYIKDAWKGTATTGSGACTLAGPDSSGFYTVQMTNVLLPPVTKDSAGNITGGATLLAGGVGYTYSVNSTRPLTQINLPAYTYDAASGVGGLSVPAPNVWKAATGYSARRAIVDNAKCKNCHVQLGVNPTFHAGHRNDGPSCSFCHTPNKTSSGWAAGSKYYIHAIHGADKRSVTFTWHSTSPTNNYGDIEFPSPLNKCSVCHVPGMYDYSNAATMAALPNMTPTTVATGKYNGASATAYTLSPYVIKDNVTDYGAGYNSSAVTGAIVEAAPTTLVISPLMTACSSCHDTKPAIAHMENMGGSFYKSRTVAANNVEQCLICHGPGTIAPIGQVHQ